MALDGILFYKLKEEFKVLETGKINKVQEVSNDEFLFTIRKNKENYKLFISLCANSPRINFTNEDFSFPQEPKSFTMLLRKHFEGAVINTIKTNETDRIMIFETSKYNELGDFEIKNLIFEMMGRYSNLIVTQNGIIIEALHHLGVSELRTILPNMKYSLPDTLGKINPFKYTKSEFINLIKGSTPLDLTKEVLGLSIFVASKAFDKDNYKEYLYDLIHENSPTMFTNQNRLDFTYINLNDAKSYPNYSSLIDDFYKVSSMKERIKQKTDNILQFVKKQIKKNESKVNKLNDEISDAKEKEIYKLYGELLISNSYIKEKSKEITVLNYYTNEDIKIPLDPKLYVKENANLYFKKYQKSKNTILHASEELIKAQNEIEYFTLLESQIENATLLEDVMQIRNELIEGKYLINKEKVKKQKKPRLLTYILPNGTNVLVGKNNLQNEIITHEIAKPNEMWFHVKDMPGSHVLVQKEGPLDEEDIRGAAMLAAYYSNAKNSSSVPVNYTLKKYIKKIPGKRRCFVTFTNEKTIYIDPDINIINTYLVKKSL